MPLSPIGGADGGRRGWVGAGDSWGKGCGAVGVAALFSAIVGGSGDNVIDGAETVLFTFTGGPATGVRVNPALGLPGGGGTAVTLEAFGVGGGSLGVFTYLGPGNKGFFDNPDLSSRVGGTALSGFRITGGRRAARVWEVLPTPRLWPPCRNRVSMP